jgi:hypothetical protein
MSLPTYFTVSERLLSLYFDVHHPGDGVLHVSGEVKYKSG